MDAITFRHITARLKKVDPTSIWGSSIKLVMDKNDPDQIELLISQLKDQATDNAPLMKSILGFDILKY